MIDTSLNKEEENLTLGERFGSLRKSLIKGLTGAGDRRKSIVLKPEIVEDIEDTPDCGESSRPPDREKSCILCLGSTGTGKSSTIGKCLGIDTRTGSGHDPVTMECETFHSEGQVWVDTRGWNDQDCTDDQIFREILTFLFSEKITSVAGIIWNVIPDIRSSAMVTCQAKLINLFHPDIWNNVIIVAKESLNPAKNCQGALHAASPYSGDISIPYTGYSFFDQEEHVDMTVETRKGCNVKMDSEIKEEILGLLAKLDSPKQLVLKPASCLDCGAKGDPRLLSPWCHMSPQFVHTLDTEAHHPGEQEKFHLDMKLMLHMTETGEKGRPRRRWFTRIVPWGPLSKKRYSCCYRRENKAPCREVWACCQSLVKGGSSGCLRRYQCCQTRVSPTATGCQSRWVCCKKELSAIGCRKECSKCHGDWGQDAGECFKKEEGHNLGA